MRLKENKLRLVFQKLNKKFSKVFKILLVLKLIGLGVLALTSNVFSINNFDCKTQYGPCLENDNKAYQAFLGKNLFLVNTKEVQNLGLQNFMNRKVSVQRVFPNTLAIVLDKRKPLVALKAINSNLLLLADREGVILEFVENSSLPTVVIQQQITGLSVGQKLDERLITAIQGFYMTYKAQGVQGAVLSDKTLRFELSDGIIVFYSLDRDPEVSVGALQLILSRSRIEGKLPKIIDLQYSKPVVRYI